VLIILLVIVSVVGTVWALAVPPWQVPDESAHFAYVQSFSETLRIPNLPGNRRRKMASADQTLAQSSVNLDAMAWSPTWAPGDWSRADWAQYLSTERLRSPSKANGGGTNPATYPPLYYLYAAVPYWLDHGGTEFGRLYLIRLFGVLLLDLTALGGWLLAGEIFGKRRAPQLVCGAVAGLMPMCTFMATGVNTDALLTPLWAFAIWLGVRVMRRGGRQRDMLALCGVTAAALLTKTTSYALLPPLGVALAVTWWQTPRDVRGPLLRRMRSALLVLLVPVIGWLALARGLGLPSSGAIYPPGSKNTASITGFLSYLWQFYLPRLPFMKLSPLEGTSAAYRIWIGSGIGQFGWLTVLLPRWVYTWALAIAVALACSTIAICFGFRQRPLVTLIAGWGGLTAVLYWGHLFVYACAIPALALVGLGAKAVIGSVRERGTRPQNSVLTFLCCVALSLLALLHLADYSQIAHGAGFMQGRYLLPGIVLFGLVVALPISRLPQHTQVTGTAVVIFVLLGLQLVSLSAVTSVYYL
jgi:4-amino-4-deoxy-L-arabinose transferase-like glycosyltransferase